MPFFVFGGCGGRFYCPALEKRKKRLSDFLDSLFFFVKSRKHHFLKLFPTICASFSDFNVNFAIQEKNKK